MNTSLPRVAPALPVVAVHTPPSGTPARPAAPEPAPDRAAPARPFADMLRQRRADASPPAAAAAAPATPSVPDEAAVAAVATDADPAAAGPAATADMHPAPKTGKTRSASSGRLAMRPEKIAAEPTPSQTPTAAEAAPQSTTDRSASPADAAAAARPLPLPDDPVAIPAPAAHDAGRRTAADIGVDVQRSDFAGDVQRSDFGGAAVSPGSAPAPRMSSGRPAEGAGPASREPSAGPAWREPSAGPEASKAPNVRPEVPVTEGTAMVDAGANPLPPEVLPLPAPLAPAAPPAPSVPAFAPAFTPLAASAPAPADPPVATLALPTPVDSPQFAGALGVHVSVLAKGGVQRAELHLNPAEMGPVSIRIELEGNAAQVQFGADLAQTRQAIERGLPELASALRDAGFTLSGGGVSQHGSQRGAGGGDAGATPSTARAAFLHGEGEVVPGSDAARMVRHVAAGGLDVYA